MNYKDFPTEKQVATATHRELLIWWRYLPSPGTRPEHSGFKATKEEIDYEIKLFRLIGEAMKSKGEITPALSKVVGWDSEKYRNH